MEKYNAKNPENL